MRIDVLLVVELVGDAVEVGNGLWGPRVRCRGTAGFEASKWLVSDFST